MKLVKIIAEAGVNHNGDRDLAKKLIDAAKGAGADIVKFQTFSTDAMVTSSAKQAEYQKINTNIEESQRDMLKRLELSYKDFHELNDYCHSSDIGFLSTAFDLESLDFLVNELKVDTLKIASGELTNAPLILEHARTKNDLIISTGMSSIEEIRKTLGIIAFGLNAEPHDHPKTSKFQSAYNSKIGQQSLKEKVTILHCVTDYPVNDEDINLNIIKTLKKEFKTKVGLSDHTSGTSIPSLAIACGAMLIEKHLTLDNKMQGPDHAASLEPKGFKKMIDNIRYTEKILGNEEKIISPSEFKNSIVGRKSIVAIRKINKGDIFSAENISIKRPNLGRSPYDYWDIIGLRSKRNYRAGQPLDD
jgi:N-acetylneuraminate synthase